MKKFILFAALLFSIALFVGCSGNEEMEMQKFVKAFVNDFYTVRDYKSINITEITKAYPNDKYSVQMKKVMNDEAFREFISDRCQIPYLSILANGHYNTEVKDFKISDYDQNKDGSAYCRYDAKIELTNADTKSKEIKDVYGALTAIKDGNGKWLFSKINKIDYVAVAKLINNQQNTADTGKQAYQPSIEVKDKNVDEQKIGESLLDLYLKHFKSNDIDEAYRLKDYKINKVKVENKEESKFAFSSDFSVQTAASGNDEWIAGNGKLSDNNWIENKYMFITAAKQGNVYKIDNMATSP